MKNNNLTANQDLVNDSEKSYTRSLTTITALFFMWGFITCMNDILIPKLKAAYNLNYTEAILIQFTFFTAYFIISLGYFIISYFKEDPIQKIGYKNTIIIGLITSGVGCFLFYPAAVMNTYSLFLGALFVLASGITLLQIGANPYVSLMGSPETASGRLNLTQAFNSLGTTVAPLIGSFLILEEVSEGLNSSHVVIGPYIGLASILFILAILIKISELPEVEKNIEKKKSNSSALKYRHLVYGIGAIFMYVGGEVAIGSFLVSFMGDANVMGFTEIQAGRYLALYWGGAMVGRFFGALFLAEKSKNRNLLVGLVLCLSFCFAWYATGYDINLALVFLGLVVANVISFFIGANTASKTVSIFAFMVVVSLVVGSFASGQLALWAIVGIGLYNSIMFPTIFTLAIKSLKESTSQGSSLLVMAIVGGALVPLVQGLIADSAGVQLSYLLPCVCYAYIMFYGMKGSKVQEI